MFGQSRQALEHATIREIEAWLARERIKRLRRAERKLDRAMRRRSA